MGEATEWTLTPDRLAELRRIAEAATQSDWTFEQTDLGVPCVRIPRPRKKLLPVYYVYPFDQEDAEFIAAFDPPTALAMLDALDEQEREIERLRWEHETIAEWVRDVLRISYPDEQMLTGMLESILALLDDEKGGGGA